MSSRIRFILLSIGLFTALCAIGLMTAYSQGADPFHARVRGTWGLMLIAALYVSFRIAGILNTSFFGGPKSSGRITLAKLFAKRETAIDRRMAERRARVEAARAKADDDTHNTDGAKP